MDLSAIRIIGRSTQGVKLINLDDNEKVVSLDSVAKDTSSDDEDIIDDKDTEVTDHVDDLSPGSDEEQE